jgi:hypothetical protein
MRDDYTRPGGVVKNPARVGGLSIGACLVRLPDRKNAREVTSPTVRSPRRGNGSAGSTCSIARVSKRRSRSHQSIPWPDLARSKSGRCGVASENRSIGRRRPGAGIARREAQVERLKPRDVRGRVIAMSVGSACAAIAPRSTRNSETTTLAAAHRIQNIRLIGSRIYSAEAR